MQRRVAPILRQAQPFPVELTLLNLSDRAASFQVIDSPPADFTGAPREFRVRLAPRQETVHTFSLKSYQRGNFAFGAVYYRVTGPLGLVQHQGRIDLPQAVQVLPDMTGEGSRDLQLALAARVPGRAAALGAARRGQRVRVAA